MTPIPDVNIKFVSKNNNALDFVEYLDGQLRV